MHRTAILLVALFGFKAFAVEGKWTPQQILEFGDSRLKRLGLQVPTRQLWDPDRGTGLLAGVVWVNGCSGAFVSEQGLLITNHHCLFSILQQHSTAQRDLMKTGFIARSMDEELPGLAERVRIPHAFTDVTESIRSVIPQGADDLQRHQAIQRKSKELTAECESKPGRRCMVESFDSGRWYTLIETIELTDVRLVYAPPRPVGEFGGDVDNWQWPRHTPDFAIARVYVGRDGKPGSYWEHNVPYRSERFFPISRQGVREGDFVMLMGYPARTYRGLIASEVAERAELYFPARRDVYREWAGLMEEAAASDPAGRIAIASDVKSLNNRQKHAEGMLAAFARGKILEKHRAAEAEVIAWASRRRGQGAGLEARQELENLVQKARQGFDRDFLLEHLQQDKYVFLKSLNFATTLARAARERKKPDLERAEPFMERNLAQIRDQLEREQKNLFLPSEKAVTLSFTRRALALPNGQRIRAIDEVFGKVAPGELAQAVDSLLGTTKVLTLAERMKMFKETEAELRARKDPLLELGFRLADELDALTERRNRMEGAGARLRPQWRKLVAAHSAIEVDPDANGTLRISFARVKGYDPRDGVSYRPHTTLNGMLAKATGKAPFVVPRDLEQAVAERRYGKWKDPVLQDVPVNFLSDADTSNGNSGSPVVNAQGELVGVNFDRVWENVANDFGYQPQVARNISADVRFLLWMLDQVVDADELLRELGMRKRVRTSSDVVY